jgi:hypothetical protein
VRRQLVETPLAERDDRVCQQPAELLERHRRGIVLGEVLLDELGEREHPPGSLWAAMLLECPFERRPCIPLTCEAATLDPPRGAPTGAIAVRPKRPAIAASRREFEDLTLLDHRRPPPSRVSTADVGSTPSSGTRAKRSGLSRMHACGRVIAVPEHVPRG